MSPTGPLTMDVLRDILTAETAAKDQREAEYAEALGVSHFSEDSYFLVSPDIGMRLTRDGVIPARVRISWYLPAGTCMAVDPSLIQMNAGAWLNAPGLLPDPRP